MCFEQALRIYCISSVFGPTIETTLNNHGLTKQGNNPIIVLPTSIISTYTIFIFIIFYLLLFSLLDLLFILSKDEDRDTFTIIYFNLKANQLNIYQNKFFFCVCGGDGFFVCLFACF